MYKVRIEDLEDIKKALKSANNELAKFDKLNIFVKKRIEIVKAINIVDSYLKIK